MEEAQEVLLRHGTQQRTRDAIVLVAGRVVVVEEIVVFVVVVVVVVEEVVVVKDVVVIEKIVVVVFAARGFKIQCGGGVDGVFVVVDCTTEVGGCVEARVVCFVGNFCGWKRGISDVMWQAASAAVLACCPQQPSVHLFHRPIKRVCVGQRS